MNFTKFCPKFIIFLVLQVLSDEMYWIDYSTNSEYKWDSLQTEHDYTIEKGPDIIKFNIGKDIKEPCGGQTASAIKFSKTGDYCEILGRHQFSYYNAYKLLNVPTIGIYYEGGSLCRDSMWGDLKRKIEFKFFCSLTESEFVVVNSLNDCTTVIEKRSIVGCPHELEYSLLVTLIFVMYFLVRFYGILGILLIWLCVEAFSEEDSTSHDWKIKKYVEYGRNKVFFT